MAEASLSLAYSDLAREVGRYLGYGPTSGNWSSDEAQEINDVIASGLRQFYDPPAISAGMRPHKWRFLRPSTTLAIVANDSDYDLPDNFGWMLGDLTFGSSDNIIQPAVKLIGEGQIRMLQQGNIVTSGPPKYAAVRPKTTTGVTGQRFELLIWPTPDATYTLSYQYRALLNKIDASNPYPYGGQIHGETILASCLAVAEDRHEDAQAEKRQRFMERLSASIEQDSQLDQEFFGYNGDGSDTGLLSTIERVTNVTYNGVLY